MSRPFDRIETRNVYDALRQIEVLTGGSPAILNNPALQLQQPAPQGEMSDEELASILKQKAIKYVDGMYHVADVLPFGMNSNTGVPYPVIAPGAQATFLLQPTCPMKVLWFGWPSDQAPGILFQRIEVGPTNLLEGGEVPASMLTEVSNIGALDWPTLPVAQPFVVTVINRGLVARNGQPSGKGVRLRK
jgi:hypothetical protein